MGKEEDGRIMYKERKMGSKTKDKKNKPWIY